ncbi:MAG: fatty acid CoA ligase family protein [Phycisphaerae bacterium]
MSAQQWGRRPCPPDSDEPLTIDAPVLNIAARFAEMAAAAPDRAAIIHPVRRGRQTEFRTRSFRELDELTHRYAHALAAAGAARGMRTILMVRPGPDFFALSFALFRIGAVPVMIDPGMGLRSMARCLANVAAEAFVGIPPAHVFRLLNPAAFRSVRIIITVGRRWFWGGHRLDELAPAVWSPAAPVATRPDETAAILFTTGSTGPPKGVVYTHATFDAQVRLLESAFGFQAGETDLATFPLFALFDAALGVTAVIPDMDPTRPGFADPAGIVAAVRDHACSTMFGSPALLDRVGRYGRTAGLRMPTLKRVISAGAPVPPVVLERFAAMLADDAEIVTPYGATEALPVTHIGHHEILSDTAARTAAGMGTCVGRSAAGVEVRVIHISDDAIDEWRDELVVPDGEIGEIVVSGPVVTREYFALPEATRAAKIHDGDRIWHRMGDVGWKDEQGRLWYCGRKSHRVVTSTGTLFTVPCEAVFNQHPLVRRTALVGIGRAPRQTPIFCVELEPDARRADRERVRRELLEIGRRSEHTQAVTTILFHPRFPVDIRHNAKIFREKLARWSARRLR